MTPGALELLSILSLLPDGLADANMVQANLPVINILACKTTLIQTSLAFVDQDQHLKVLVPIREHILHTHPPADALKLKLREHFHQILDLWNQFKNLNVADILPQISRNLANFNTVLRDGLQPEGPDILENFRSIMFLNNFLCRVQATYSPLLLQLAEQMPDWKENSIWGEYVIQLLESSHILPALDLNRDIILGTQYFKTKDTLQQGKTQLLSFTWLIFHQPNGTKLWEFTSMPQSRIVRKRSSIFKEDILWQKVLDTPPLLAALL
jgi:hypothetical protein